MDNDPLKLIFKLNSKGECTSELETVSNIQKFFEYLQKNQNGDELSPTFEEKSKIITNFCNIIKENRTIVIFFSSYNDRSIYFYLFDLYLNNKSSEELKKSIILLLNELRINIQTNKEIYCYLFNKLSLIYRGDQGDENFTDILNLLNTLLGETENYLKPRNYFACNGQGKFILELDNKNLEIGYCLTFIINFKVNRNISIEESKICNLLTIKMNNKSKIKINLKFPDSIMLKNKVVKTLPQYEWINLIINVVNTDKGIIKLFFFVNGENEIKEEEYEELQLKHSDIINSMEFFENFYGEVTSIILLSQLEEGDPGVQTDSFLSLFKLNMEGIWKRKFLEKFLENMSKINSINIKKTQETPTKKEINSLTRANTVRDKFSVTHRKLKDDIIFILSTFNYIDACPNLVEDCLGKFNDAFYYGNIRNNKYICYQNNINSVCDLTNLFPIAEMFLIHPKLLTEINFEIFLKIIENILNFRKNNIVSTKYCKFFKVLCLFLEKYPKSLYTRKILDSFANIGKTMFRNNSESLCKTYFKHILLNEKILSKYNSNLQIDFWTYIKLFCESDSSQIEKFINMNRISLLLRFYDRKKYKEMCCKEHLDVFKEEYIKNKKIMDPPLNKKLSYIKDVLNVIIYFQEPKNCIYLFKLLTLDLSPCLTKFILNLFTKALEGNRRDNNWKNEFIKELINNNYETILINTFIHSLPDVRFNILELMYQIRIKGIRNKQIAIHELMFKPFLLPTKIFYVNNNNKTNEEKNIVEEKVIKNDNNNYIEKEEEKLKKEDIKIENNEKNINEEVLNEKNDIKNKDINNSENKEGINISISKEESTLNQDEMKNIEKNSINENQKIEGTMVIKEEIYQKYIDQLFSSFLLWSLTIQIDFPYTSIHLPKSYIKDLNILQHLFEINSKIEDINFLKKLVDCLGLLMENQENSYKILYNKKIFSLILDLSFYCYKKKEKDLNQKEFFEEYYNKCKDIIINMYINSLSYTSVKDITKFPSKELETIYVWGDKMLMNEGNRIQQNLIHSFMDEILFVLLTNFKINFESNMEFNVSDKNNNITNGYFFNNYIIFISELYHYCFQFRLDTLIYKNGLNVVVVENKNEVILPPLFMYSMRIDTKLGKKINDSWIDFRYIYEIYHRIKFIWQKDNFYKTYEKGKNKTNNKFKKYEQILQNIISDKSQKNLYKKELEFLFYQSYDENNIDIIVPVIKIIQIFMMCIISVYINRNEENELLEWIKEFRKLLRFIIVSSSNLIMKDQVEFYEKIQENALYVITIGICFLRKCLITTKICKLEIEKILINNIMLCLFIHRFHINYFNSHKKNRIFGSTKFNRNDLSNSAVVNLFEKYILDKNDQVIFNLGYTEQILTEKHYYDKIRHLLYTQNSDLEIGLFKNKKIINLIYEKYFGLYAYKSIVDSRFKEINDLKDNFESDFSKKILELLPLYEKELAKYSNNSLEKNLDKKNLYRKIKKHLFSWNGYWSDKSIFYNEDISIINNNSDTKINENNNELINKRKNILKYKLLNHYTKSFMKPLLVPILDMSYYLPNFTGFDSEKLFNHKNKQIINLDIDQILKLDDSKNLNENIDTSKENNNPNKNNQLIDEKKEENYLREIYIKSNPEVAEKLLKISNNLDFGKEEEEYIEEKSGTVKSINQTRIYFLSCLVKTSHHIKGVCFVDENQLKFKVFLNQQTGKSMNGINLAFTENDEDYDPDRKTCYGSYFMFHHKDKNLYKISIKYSEIKFIFRRRYYYKNSALEIFTNKNKSFYFNFKYENDREVVLENILKKLKNYNKIVIDLRDTKDNFDNIIGFQRNNALIDVRKSIFKKNSIYLSEKVDNWKKWKISNFEFLMWLNIYSNRSYNDISQYPVFPWTLINYEDPIKKEIVQNDLPYRKNSDPAIDLIDYSYRDLSSPIGMLGIGEEGEKRKENYIMSYEELKNESNEFEGQKPYFYGSNYSNPIYTCNFMIRIFPFTHISIELQGNKIDDSNRLFFSIKNTFYTCTSHKTDVRELIPEFFYLPEMLLNINDINLGIREDGSPVNDVSTPCNDDPYKFIDTMKNVLENNKVSYNLQNWIDLIFGNKARGKEAELAKNIFTETSYQENIDLNKVEDKTSVLRTVEFGLIPNQIMTKECPKKERKDDSKKGREITDINSKLKIFKCRGENVENDINEIRKKNKINMPILKARIYNNDKMITFNSIFLTETKISYSGFDKSFYEEKISSYASNSSKNRIKHYYENNNRQDKSIIICNQGKTIILGGFYDGSIKILNFAKNIFTKKFPFKTEEPVFALAIDEEEKYLFAGNSIGNIIIYKIDFDAYEWEILLNNTDQLSEISHIHVNNELNLWLSATLNGYINLYTIPSFKLIRSLKTKAKNLEYAFLSTSTLPSILIINKHSKFREIYSYSINGKFLKYEKEENSLLNPIIIKDSYFNEYLVYICKNNNSIIIRNLPFLNIQNIIQNLENISCISVSEDAKLLYALSNEDDQLYVVKDDPKQIAQNNV